MKNIISFVLCLFLGTQLFSQTATPETVTPEEYATLQTNEFADHFNFNSEKREKLYKINLICWSKIKDTYATDMPDNVKLENKIYNIKIRQQAVYTLLTDEQLSHVGTFLSNSTYNQIEQF